MQFLTSSSSSKNTRNVQENGRNMRPSKKMTCHGLFVRKRKLISYHNISVFGDILWGNVHTNHDLAIISGFCPGLKKGGHCAGSGMRVFSLAVLHFDGTFVCVINYIYMTMCAQHAKYTVVVY